MNLHSMGHAFGMAWYLRKDYRRIVEIMEDGEQFPPSFDAWLGIAETLEAKFSDCGLFVIRVTIEPETFLAWRAARGLPADAALRDLFASECVFRQMDQTTKQDQAAPSSRKSLVRTAAGVLHEGYATIFSRGRQRPS
jgi:hypothetical protein